MCIEKFEKSMQEWEMICKEVGMRSWKLKMLIKTKFVSKVVLFLKKLEYYIIVSLYYNPQTSRLQAWVPSSSM
jgi:hypothetical protein